MDFITGLLPSKYKNVVYDSILVIIDRFTKMVRYISTNVIIDAAELAEVFHTKIVCRYSILNGIISNRGSIFTSTFWLAVYFYSKIKRRLSTAFYPQTDG